MFMAMLGAAALVPRRASRAQGRLRVVGIHAPWLPDERTGQSYLQAFRQGLVDAGWTEGRNVRLEIRFSGADAAKIAADARDLAALAPDVIFTFSNPALAALVEATRTIPIVFAGVGDPVAAGFVPSLAHPGGNVTGFALFAPDIAGKWLEFLKEAAPQVTMVTLLLNAATPSHAQYRAAAQAVAGALSVTLIDANVENTEDVRRAMKGLAGGAHAGLVVLPHNVTAANAVLIVAEAVARRIPAVYPFPVFAQSGGLISYGPELADECHRAATYVDRVLRGEKPGDLPVQNATKFQLSINLKTAAEMSLTVPATLLAQADEVIE
jgi:putative tryptophan/tyrosine transport system substrate-binding protein